MDFSHDLEPTVTRKRASKPKTRFGCRTCKTRRVKCDETKPGCLRCAKFGHECGGYPDIEDLKRTPSKPQPVTHRLLPKTPQRQEELSLYRSFHLTGSYGSMNERDGNYFQLFRQDIASELSGGFESILWNRIILQACEDTSIRQLTIATAALKQSVRLKPGQPDELKNHREYALQKYSQAVKTIQKRLSTGQENIRVALLAALLIFALEAILGDTKVASKHVQSALDLLNHRLALKSTPPSHSGGRTQMGVILPNIAAFVEDEVLKSFIRLDRPAVGLLSRNKGSRPIQNRILSSKLYLKSFEVPRCFTSIEEARYCYECIRFRVFPEHKFEEKLKASASLPEGITSPAILLMRLFSELAENDKAPILRAELAQWQRAFAPLFRHSRTPQGTATFIPATTLFIQATSLEIPLYGFNDAPSDAPSVMYNHLVSARKVLAHAHILIASPKYPKCFVFDMGIIPSLWIIVVLCLDLSLKKKALNLLREMQPRIECVLDSRVVADTGEAFVDMIEQMQKDRIRHRCYDQGGESIEPVENRGWEDGVTHNVVERRDLQMAILYFGSLGSIGKEQKGMR